MLMQLFSGPILNPKPPRSGSYRNSTTAKADALLSAKVLEQTDAQKVRKTKPDTPD